MQAEGRILTLNDAVVKIDSLVTKGIPGENVSNVYRMLDGSQQTKPEVLREKRSIGDRRQHYGTRYGKAIDDVSRIYRTTQSGQLPGAFNITQGRRPLSLKPAIKRGK